MTLFIISSDALPLLLILIMSLVLRWWLLKDSKVKKLFQKIPGPRAYPIIGNALEFLHPEELLRTLSSANEKYGNRVKVVLGSDNILLLCHPDDVGKILSSPALTAKSGIYKFFLPWLGSGLFLSKGKKWRESRRLGNQILFHSKILQRSQTVFNEQSGVMVDIIKEKIAVGENLLKMHKLFMSCTLDIIYETATGVKLNSQRDAHNLYAEAVEKASEHVFKRMTSPWLHSDLIFKYSNTGREATRNLRHIQGFFAKIIKERKLLRKSMLTQRSEDAGAQVTSEVVVESALDIFIQKQQDRVDGLSDEEIRDEINSVMFAGHDTTASNLIWTLFLLGTHPDAQKKVHHELTQVFGEDKERPASSSDLSNLKYLEGCIKEALRLFPVSSLFGRTIEQDFKLDEETVLPKGLDVVLSPWITHRLPEFFPDPEEFRPSRHFPENSKGRHPYAFIPFSAGPRNCPGIKFALAENKTILARLLRSFHVSTVDDPAGVVVLPEIVTRPKGDIRFCFTVKR